MEEPGLDPEIDLHVQEILLAASQHDLTTLRHLLRSYSFPDCESVDVQDSETGFTSLHASIAACEMDEETQRPISTLPANGFHPSLTGNDNQGTTHEHNFQEELILGAQETVRCLLQHGAIWNQLDMNNETPGCIAHRIGQKDLYELMVDAGVRAELLLSRLEGYEQLQDSDEIEPEGPLCDQINGTSHVTEASAPSYTTSEDNIHNARYLASALSLTADKILDERSNGVMMSWESGIMAKSANALLTSPNMKILNIGFGMGIIDNHFQTHSNKPASHHIVEAHPTVLADMAAKGWYSRTGVVVHEGRWQDILPNLVAESQTFDAIYFDTFAESYSEFRDFASEHVIGLLEPAGKFSFFNGMGADRQISYDVYQKVVEMDLFEVGFDIDWQEVEVPQLDGEWEDVKRKYWNMQTYRLPVCRFMD